MAEQGHSFHSQNGRIEVQDELSPGTWKVTWGETPSVMAILWLHDISGERDMQR